MMKHKSLYPYDYMDPFQKFNEKQLPNKNDFHGIWNTEHIKKYLE